MAPQPPADQERSDIDARLEDPINAIMSHPQWTAPPNQNPTLFHISDFVMRSKYILFKYGNIKFGHPVQHPEQFKSVVGKGEAAALRSFQDVSSRTMMLQMLASDPRQAAMITGNTGPQVDLGKGSKMRSMS